MTTPKLRFKEFDGGWVLKKIGEIASKVGSGSTPRGGAEAYTDEGIIFIRSQNVNNDQLLLDDVVFIPETTHKKMSGSKVFANDILLNITGASIGRSCVVPSVFSEGNVNQHVCIIRTPNDDPIFVQSFLSSENGQNHIQSKQVGGGREGLNFQAIRSIDLAIPSKSEQTKIASFLSVVDEKISQLTQEHELLSQYKQGMMQKLFSQQLRFKVDDGSEFGEWEEQTLGKIVNFHNGKRIPLSETERQNRQGTYRYFGASGVIDYVDGYLFDGQYILIGEDGANILTRSTALAFVVQGQFWVNNHAHIFQSKSGNNFFLAAYLESLNYEKFNSGTAQPKLNLENLKKVPVLYPCLEEQTKIANFLSAIDQKIEVVAQQIEQAKQWKKGLLQQMFV
ncbi:MAG: restriction endonuclease subunit S [Acinetobacter sp.]